MRTVFGETFDLGPGYLNTASVGVPPRSVVDAMHATIDRWSAGADQPPVFDKDVAVARRAWASLVGVEPATVAIGAAVSQLVGLVAASVPDRSRVLVAAGEFTSVTFPFAAQAHRGVTVTEAALTELPDRIAGHDLVAVSAVQSADGAVADLDAIASAAADAGAMVLVDVTQAAGWLPLRLDWADWVVGSGYKWLLSPRGTAWLAASAAGLDLIHPHSAGWYAGEDPWTTVYDLPLRLAGDARRLDLSPVWFAQVGSAVAVDWLAGLDTAAVRAHCVGLADAVLAGIGRPPGGSAIIAVDAPDAGRLAATGVTSSVRAGRIRLSFHLYNTEDDVQLVLDALR